MGIRGNLLLLPVLAPLLASGCLEVAFQNGGVKVVASSLLSPQNCALPNGASVKKINSQLRASATPIDAAFCASADNYRCYKRIFSPLASDGKSVEDECATLDEMGGDACLKVAAQSYNTREPASVSDPAASQPGGDYNRSEYVCHQAALQDGDVFLARGEGESLREALGAAFKECATVLPRLQGGRRL